MRKMLMDKNKYNPMATTRVVKVKRYLIMRGNTVVEATGTMKRVAEIIGCRLGDVATQVTYKKQRRFELNGYTVIVNKSFN